MTTSTRASHYSHAFHVLVSKSRKDQAYKEIDPNDPNWGIQEAAEQTHGWQSLELSGMNWKQLSKSAGISHDEKNQSKTLGWKTAADIKNSLELKTEKA